MKALIAEDEPHLARALAAMLPQLWPELELLPVARNGLEAARIIQNDQPELAFLDIQMPGLTGLEVAQGIEGPTRVVFVIAYDQYAVQAFEAQALDYVLKPIQTERLQKVVKRAQQALQHPQPPAEVGDERLFAALRQLLPGALATGSRPTKTRATPLRWIRAGSGETMAQVDVHEVLYFHADDKYTVVQTARAEHLIRTPIAELALALDPEQFVQAHRSTIVNLNHLAGTRRDEASRLFLRFKGHGKELPVSRAYVHLFKAM